MGAQTADELKDEGNVLFKNKEWLKSAAVYTKGIKVDPEHAVLYSNRSAAFLQLLKVQKALGDAEMCIKLRPTWEKGYYRKGCALEALDKFDEALAAFRDAAEHNPNNTEVTKKIANIQRHVNSLKRKQVKKAADGSSEFKFGEQKAEKAPAKGEAAAAPAAGKKLGADIPYSKERLEQWAKAMLSDAVNNWVAGNMAAYAKFLPGCKDADGDVVEGEVKIAQAFDAPDTLESCTQFLRQYGADVRAHAAAVVVPKATMAFPQVWKKNGWKAGDANGFFVQVDSPEVKRLWFVPAGKSGKSDLPRCAHVVYTGLARREGAAAPRAGRRLLPTDTGRRGPGWARSEPVSLDVDTFRLVPPLIQKAQ